ncbi:MAG: hypothetical protein RLZZ387_266 [Chloroflexota bacterium]
MTDALSARIQPLLDAVADQLAPDAGDFVGRAAVRVVIRDFTALANRMLVIVAPPGVGKTALAAELVHESLAAGSPHLAHFCTLRDGADPSAFVRSLALQVQDALGGEYRLPQTLSKQLNITVNQNIAHATSDTRVTGVEIKELNLGSVHPREAFRLLVREPLRAYDELRGAERAGRPLLIVIDALDQAWEWDGGQGANIVSLLADVQDLPPWVNLICTARSGPAVQALRAQAGVRVYDLEPLGAENLGDIRAYFEQRFIDQLSADERERFLGHLVDSDLARTETNLEAGFVRRAAAASQGNFLFVRRYAAAWQAALTPAQGKPSVEPAALLRFDSGGGLSLATALDASYRAVFEQLQQRLDADERDADTDVLTALAIAFEPLTLPLLGAISGREQDQIEASLRRLEPVIARDGPTEGRTYRLYHRGFADYVRRGLPRLGREQDIRAARALELADGSDPALLAYAARYRWPHLLRGLDMSAGDGPQAQAAAGVSAPAVDQAESWQEHVEQVRAMTRSPAVQAQLLRALAAQAIHQSRSDTPGSWAAAMGYLQAAEQIVRRSRALVRVTRRGGRIELSGAQPPEELLELERVLVALGDTYTTIARRMDGGTERSDVGDGLVSRLYLLWNTIVRLPLTIYLLIVLVTQGVREIHIPGALQNLGREQDWAVARLLVLAVSAYRRAGTLARLHGSDTDTHDVVERLGRVYKLMGAYDVAAASYEMLLARPAAILSPWRQAVWLLELGEVLLAQRKPDRAVEVLMSALPTFVDQQAPVLLARAQSGLARAEHQQAERAAARRDDPLAARADELAIASCGAALSAWLDVTNLRGDDLAAVDPPLAIGRVAHILRRTAGSARISDELHRRATAELERIEERHYAQRFEHPLLRLFRVTATVLLPAYILAALLLAVQTPSIFLLTTDIDPAVRMPLVDLNSFPNNLISGGGATPVILTRSSLLQLSTADANQIGPGDLAGLLGSNQLQPAASASEKIGPPGESLATITGTALLVVAVYLGLYTLAGLAVVVLVSPAQLQHRRPGRLVLRRDSLSWQGAVSRGTLFDTGDWLRHAALHLGARAADVVRRVVGIEDTDDEHGHGSQGRSVALADITGVVTVDRRVLGFLLGDFSSATVQAPGQTLVIPGTVERYEMLCADLRERLGRRYRAFSTEIIRSFHGLLFLLTVLYALALIALLPLMAWLFQTPLPLLGYGLDDLYVLAAPGLVLPLVWWFVAQPLGAAHLRSATTARLLVTTVVGATLTLVVVTGVVDTNLLQIEPDLLTPALALAILGALIVYTPPRPLRALASLSLRNAALAGVTLAAAAGTALLCWNLATTALWYHEMVRGDTLLEQAAKDKACAGESCPTLEAARRSFTTMICLRPGAPEGYALHGLAALMAGDHPAAREDFAAALAVGTPGAKAPPPGCLPASGRPLSPQVEATIRANLGTVQLMEAQQASAPETDELYDAALRSYGAALGNSAAAGTPTCTSIAREVLGLDMRRGLERDQHDTGRVSPESAALVLQVADLCYSRGLTRARDLRDLPRPDQAAVRQAMWDDVSAAVAQYGAAGAASQDLSNQERAQRGLAAGWLLLGQLESPPGSPDAATHLLRAQELYRSIEEEGPADVSAQAGQAWSTLLLGAWSEARTPLARARDEDPSSPVYPALEGLTYWLDGTRYPLPGKSNPSPSYTAAMRAAVERYSEVIALSDTDLDRAYATRSALYWSLRNSPQGEEYRDEDYGTWMRLAIADVDRALIEAEGSGLEAEELAAYRYWSGRLHFSLALTWQRKLRGRHEWQELVPLFGRALNDFERAVEADLNPDRRKSYADLWGPWSRFMLTNATSMSQAEAAARAGEWEQARRALEMVEPRVDPVRQRSWDQLSGPRPEYSLLHGLVSLALGAPEDFVNLLTESSDPEASYAQAFEDLENTRVVPAELRAELYERARDDLEALLEDEGLSLRSEVAAKKILREIGERAASLEP